MTFEEFHRVLQQKNTALDTEMFAYGLSCGQHKNINFDAIRQLFEECNLLESEKANYLQELISGFREGLTQS